MHLGSRTLTQWAALLSQPSPSSPSPPPHALTWAARLALTRACVLHPRNLPAPATPTLPLSASPPPSPPSVSPSPPPSPPPLPPAIAYAPPPPTAPSSETDTWSPPAQPAHPAPPRRRPRPPRARFPNIHHPDPPLPPRKLRGLVNCGNSCFINVVLQALLACHPFRRLLLRCGELGLGQTPPAEKELLLTKFVRLAQEMSVKEKAAPGAAGPCAAAEAPAKAVSATGSASAANGVAAKAAPPGKPRKENGFAAEEPLLPDFFYDVFPGSAGAGAPPGAAGAGGSQEDAEEFLSFVLNALHEELVELDKQADPDAGDELEGVGGKQNGRISPVTANGALSVGKWRSGANGVWNGSHQALMEDSAGNGVWEEMTRKGKTIEIRGGDFAESGITDIFGGALRSEVKRGRAKPSVTREPFFRLSLDIESGMIRDVEHALTAYFEPEQLEGYTMERGGGGGQETVEARKQVLLHMAPQVLILHLKRFSHNTVTGALNKVSRQMRFPEVLEVASEVVYGGGRRRSYVLTGVVTHIGKELAGGHYTCDVRWGGEESETWVTCDDSKVGRSCIAKVLRKQAYLLFYSLRTAGDGRGR